MRWRDVIIGALASLFVTVVGGVTVYYATKEPDEKKNEKLVYEISRSAEFISQEKQISFSTVTIRNLGGVVAKNVVISVNLKEADINDVAINTNIGLKETTQEIKKKSLKVTYANFMPNEKVTINLIISKAEKVEVDVRSESSLGQDSSQLLQDNSFAENTSKKNILLYSLLIILLLLWYLVVFKFVKHRKFKSQNNAGFVLLHSGLTDQAEKLFLLAIDNGDYCEFTLSNLALCQAIKGNYDKAEALLKATNFATKSKHGRAVVLFNKSLIKLIESNKDEALNCLRQAIQLSPKEIRKYCQLSILLDVVRNEPAYYDLLKDN
ncbi:tetratricopeptide repeat protein [Acinetobacter nosocomialis]|uniref:tetratricopeptide repeat protein n=1 Tax=Acinetobacter nosocomialis TaxID=106654 RepID=UPI00125F311E|nr:tetratricopeptide repeat protein [Acinetobacter nosocomialis]MCE5997495.1 tetratricopeptide repeat protein [Acinetobacter nosocomialis]MCH2009290.1 tetratricopeptide repeat protein [Acinetobacter nosocomialis]HBM1867961.1 hypothetical protein [Acinetobacter nosocomialis]HCT3319330.1 hypothetical protein [Acinetobacter nosocomialis]